MAKKTRFASLLSLLLIISCATQKPSVVTIEPQAVEPDVVRIAILMTEQDMEESEFGEEIMIGVSRTAQEFGGSIVGTEGTVTFGDEVEFTVIPTQVHATDIVAQLQDMDLSSYALVFGCGHMYHEPILAVHRKYPGTHFVGVDAVGATDRTENFTSLLFNITDAAFMAGVIAATKVEGKPLGFIGGMDLPFLRKEFFGGFEQGVRYADSLNGTDTEVRARFLDSFNEFEQGKQVAAEMYSEGIACIYQAAGAGGWGAIEAAAEAQSWIIGVDFDQALHLAKLGNENARFVLTSTVKRWGTGIYLVSAEFITTGKIPAGPQVVGLPEGCVDIAINPYNSAALASQMELIAEVRETLLGGEIPAIVTKTETAVWESLEKTTESKKVSLTVNTPEFSEGVDASAIAPLQQALSTALHGIGRYRVIDPQQRRRLLDEIKTSLEGTSDEKLQLEVGRLMAAEVVVFVHLSVVGTKLTLDIKIVDVETGITLSANQTRFEDIDKVFDGVESVVQNL